VGKIDHSIEFDAVIGAMQGVMDKCLGVNLCSVVILMSQKSSV